MMSAMVREPVDVDSDASTAVCAAVLACITHSLLRLAADATILLRARPQTSAGSGAPAGHGNHAGEGSENYVPRWRAAVNGGCPYRAPPANGRRAGLGYRR